MYILPKFVLEKERKKKGMLLFDNLERLCFFLKDFKRKTGTIS